MKQLEADIKNRIYRRIYVLYGEQSYNRKRYVEALVGIFLRGDDALNLTRFYGKKTDIKTVIETATTMPFFSEKRVIVLENTELFSRSCDELADFIPEIPETCVMIFSEEKIDQRLRQSKAAKSCGQLAQFGNLTEPELRDWVIRKLAREHRPITEAALDMLLKRCSDDLWMVSNDLERLISYTFGKDGIRPEDVDAVCPALPEDRIFNMIDAVLDHNIKKAMACYRDLYMLRSDPMGILGLLREQYRLMLHVRELNDEHVSVKDMAGVLKMRDTRIKMALSAARKSSKIKLTECIRKCADTDERIKTGAVDAVVGVETLITELSMI